MKHHQNSEENPSEGINKKNLGSHIDLEQQYRSLFDSNLFCVFLLDFEGNILDANNAALNLLGYTRADIPLHTIASLVGEDQMPLAHRTIEEIKQNGTQQSPITFSVKKKNGEHVWIEVEGSLIHRDGKPYAIQGIGRDITLQKITEQELKESENRYRSIFENTGTATVIIEEDTTISMANQEAENLTGFKRDEIEGKSWEEIMVKEELEMLREYHRLRRTDSDLPPRQYETKLIDKNGNVRDVFVTAALIPGMKRSIASLLDITDRKRDMKALQTSEEKFRKLVENADEAIIVAQEGILKFVNPKTTVITGYPSEELISKPFVEFIHPDDRSLVLERHNHRMSGKEVPEIYPFRIIDKEGKVRWVEINAVRIDWEGRPATLNFLTEITKRKQLEEQLFLKSRAIESSINAIAISDLDANLTYVNISFLRLWGYGNETEVLGRPAVDFWQTKEEALKVIESLHTQDQGNWLGELIARRKDGSLFDVQLSASLVRDENGKPVSMMGSFIDITKRKQAEESLKARERDLEIKTKSLEEINAALNLLLKKREEDKTELEEKVQLNIKQLIEPFLTKLKQSGLDERQKTLTTILESNLNDITSSFALDLSTRHLNLTPKEVKVANLIKQGKMSKEICEILGSSDEVIAFHRKNIRKKLGLLNKKVNLKSYLIAKA